MLRALNVEEVVLVSGGMMEDADEFDDGSGGDYGFDDGGDYGDGMAGETSAGTPTYEDPETGDIVVTAPFTKSEVESMVDEAKHMTDVQFTTGNALIGLAGFAAGLGPVTSTGLTVAAGYAENNKAFDTQTDKNFDYIYNRQLAINNGTARYGNGYPALQIP